MQGEQAYAKFKAPIETGLQTIMHVSEFRNYPELLRITRNYSELGVPRETTLYANFE